MAVRNANAYIFDSFRSVLGSAAPPAILKNDYPIDLYKGELNLKEGAKTFMEVWKEYEKSEWFDAKKHYYVNGRPTKFKGKRDFGCRVGRWASLPGEVAYKLYASFESGMKARDMSLLLPHIKCHTIHGDCKGTFMLLKQLSTEAYTTGEKGTVRAASAVAKSALHYVAPTYLALADPHYAAMETICSGDTSFAQLLHIEARLMRLLELCKRISRSKESNGLRSKLAKMVASHKWYTLEAEDEVIDSYLSMAMNASIAMPLEELEDRMEAHEDAGEYDKSDACEELSDKVRVAASELKLLGSKIMSVPIGCTDCSFVSCDGLMLVVSGVGYLQSTKDIGLAIELVQEAISSLADMLTTSGLSCGMAYQKAVIALWSNAAELSPDNANFMSCAHRDYELAVKQVDIKAFDRQGKFVTVCDCNKELSTYAKGCSTVVSRYMDRRPKSITPYHWARSMRCVPLCRFSATLLVSEAKRVYDITHDPEDEALERLALAIALQLALCYKARHGISPKGFDEVISQLGENTSLSGMIDAMSDWDYKGAAKFDDKATIARDKSNIPKSRDILMSARAYNGAQPNLRREILYFEENNKDTETMSAVNYFKAGSKGSVKAHVGVKPESKEGGRAVTSERSDIRKANTTITNNLLPYVDQIQGSLMAASPAKKEKSVHDMVTDGKNLDDHVSYFLATDFVKFGHSLSCKLQRVVFKVVADFFDRPWIANVPDMLPRQEVCCIYGDHYASFMNTTGGDGQGMRNAVWQLMLAGCLVFVNAELGGQIENVRSEKPLSLLYFMDDHLFRTLVKHKDPVIRKGRIDRTLMQKLNSIEDAICRAYNRIGLGTNEEKNTRSLHGAILTGMHISDRGRENVPGRAIQRAYVETSHRAPSIVDVVANVAGSCVGAIEDGRDRAASLAISVFLSSLKIASLSRSACRRNPSLIGSLLVTPVSMGGMGHPIEADIVVQSGPNSYDDHLFNLFFHLTNKTDLTSAATAIYHTLSHSKKHKLRDCGSVFTAKHNRILESPSSTIRGHLKKTSLGERFDALEGMRQHLGLCLDYLEKSYEIMPATVAKAVVSAHPYSVAAGELDRVISSATSVMLLGHDALQSAKRSSAHRSMTYLTAASRLSSPVTPGLRELTWEEFVWDVGQACEGVKMETPPRGPKFSLVWPCNSGAPDLEAHSILAGETYSIIEPGSNATSVSRGSELWCSMERTAVNSAVDLLVMSNSCAGAAAVGVVACSMYKREYLLQLMTIESVEDPFRCLPSVQYCPQTSGYGVRKELQSDYVTAESMVSIRSTLPDSQRAHVNHGAAMVVALVASKCCRSFEISSLAGWTEPVFVPSGVFAKKPVTIVSGPKVSAAMVAAIRGLCTSATIAVFRNFTSEALNIFAYMSKSVAINRRLCHIEAQAPVVPSGAKSHYLNPVADAIRQEKPSKQADAVLKIMAIQVMGRVARSDDSEQCLGIVASAQAKLVNYLGCDPANAKWVKMLVPTNAECNEAFAVCQKAGILQAMMLTLNRYYRSAKHAELTGVETANPKAFQDYATGAVKSWHRLLHSNIGELCSLQATFDDVENYSRSALYWAARHQRHYGHNAEHARASKVMMRPVPPGTMAELLSYEMKAKVMTNLANMSVAHTTPEEALTSTRKIIHNVYSRMTAKRLNKSKKTVLLMVKALDAGGHPDAARAIELSINKAAVVLEMVSNDLYLSIRKPHKFRVLVETSKIIGEQSIGGHDRQWAESGDQTTSRWVKFYKVSSIFGTNMDPILDYAYIGREADSAASPFDSKSSKSVKLKSRTKVRYASVGSEGSSVGSQSHTRSSYGVETQPGRRHGVSFLPDPTDLMLRLRNQRADELSPLTLPSLATSGINLPELTLPPLIQNVDLIAPPATQTLRPDTALATGQVVSSSSRRARGSRRKTLNFANARDWTDL